MALVTENNRQYYEGAQSFGASNQRETITTTFDTNLKFFTDDKTSIQYNQNNFKLYYSATKLPGSYEELHKTNIPYSVVGNVINFTGEGQTTTTSASPPGANEVVFRLNTGSIEPQVGYKITLSGSSVSWTQGSAQVNYAIINNVTLENDGRYTVSYTHLTLPTTTPV